MIKYGQIWEISEFFKNVGLNLEDMNLKSVKSNKLDYEITKISTFEQIDISMMNNYIDNNRLIKINKIYILYALNELKSHLSGNFRLRFE